MSVLERPREKAPRGGARKPAGGGARKPGVFRFGMLHCGQQGTRGRLNACAGTEAGRDAGAGADLLAQKAYAQDGVGGAASTTYSRGRWVRWTRTLGASADTFLPVGWLGQECERHGWKAMGQQLTRMRDRGETLIGRLDSSAPRLYTAAPG